MAMLEAFIRKGITEEKKVGNASENLSVLGVYK